MKKRSSEDVSTLEIKKILQNTIEEEERKPTDDQLAEILKRKAIHRKKNHCKIQRTTRYSSGENEEEDVFVDF
jgi:plasmid stability protein